MYRCFPVEHAARSRDQITAICDELANRWEPERVSDTLLVNDRISKFASRRSKREVLRLNI